MRNKLKKTNGITLVALIITIILLMILAGITISMVIGRNGIITKTHKAEEQHNKAKIEEKLSLEIANMVLEEKRNLQLEDLDKLAIEEYNITVGEIQQDSDGKKRTVIIKDKEKEYQFKINQSLQIQYIGNTEEFFELMKTEEGIKKIAENQEQYFDLVVNQMEQVIKNKELITAIFQNKEFYHAILQNESAKQKLESFHLELVEKASSNEVPSGIISASSEHPPAYFPYKAFNQSNTDPEDCWHSLIDVPQWIQIQFHEAKVIYKFSITNRNIDNGFPQIATKFELQGSNDGTNWTTLQYYENNDLNPRETKEYYLEEITKGCFYYRIYITEAKNTATTTDHKVAFAMLQFYGI